MCVCTPTKRTPWCENCPPNETFGPSHGPEGCENLLSNPEKLYSRVKHLEAGLGLIRATIAWYSYLLPDKLEKKLTNLINEILDPTPVNKEDHLKTHPY